MIKRFCDACKKEIEEEYLKVVFRESIIDDFGEFHSSDESEFCKDCHKEGIKTIENRPDNQREKMRKFLDLMKEGTHGRKKKTK